LTDGTVALWRLCWTNVALARTLITSLVVLPRGRYLGKGTFVTDWQWANLAFAFTCATTVFVHCGKRFLTGQTVTSGNDCWTDWPFTRTNLATILNLTHDSLLAEWALVALQIFTSRDEVTSTSVATILIFRGNFNFSGKASTVGHHRSTNNLCWLALTLAAIHFTFCKSGKLVLLIQK